MTWSAGRGLAQCPQNIAVDLGDRTIAFDFETDTPGSSTRLRAFFGEDPSNLVGRTIDRRVSGNIPTASDRILPLAGLAPSTTYYFDLQVSDASGNFGDWDACETKLCPTLGIQPGSYECVLNAGRRRPRFTTLSLDVGAPVDPIAPLHLDPGLDDVPPVDGSVFTVTLDEQNRCTDLQAKLEQAAAANPNQHHEVLVPAGGVCRPEHEGLWSYTLPDKIGTGLVTVRCDVDPLLMPPAGVRIDPSWKSGLCRLETSSGDLLADRIELINLTRSNCGSSPCTEGWRIVGFRIGPPPHEEVVRNAWPVVSVIKNGANSLTAVVDGIVDKKFGLDSVQFHLPGMQSLAHHRACLISNPTINVSANQTSIPCNVFPAVGDYAGGGWLTDRVSTPLAECAEGSNPVCTTAEPHPFGNAFSFPVQSVVDGAVTTQGSHQLEVGVAVKLEGSGSCDGVYRLQSANRTAGTAQLSSAPSGSCTGGSIRNLASIYVFDVRGYGASEANGVQLFSVIDDLHIQLLEVTLPGPAQDGYFSYDPPVFRPMFRGDGCRRCVFDRIVLDGTGPPFRIREAFNWAQFAEDPAAFRNQSGVTNSWVGDINVWFPTDKLTGTAHQTSVNNPFSNIGLIHHITQAKDIQVLNTTHFASPGISVFAQEGVNRCAEDITFDRGMFYLPESRIAGFPEARGLYFTSRHFLEFKCGKRIRVRGQDLRHNPANAQPSGAAVIFFPVNARRADGSFSSALDIDVRFNTLWENAGTLDLVTSLDGITNVEAPKRIAFSNNLALGDRVRWRTAPHNQAGQVSGQWGSAPFYGRLVRESLQGVEDLKLENNTVPLLLGSSPEIWLSAEQFGSTVRARKNIFPFSTGNGLFKGIAGTSLDYLPAPAGAYGYPLWSSHYRAGPTTPDPLSEWDNVIVPCQADAKQTVPVGSTTTNNLASDAASHFSCGAACPSNFANQIVGGDPQTCLHRKQVLFGDRKDFSLPTGSQYQGYGVDIETLRDNMGLVRDLTLAVNGGSATLSFRAPDGEACWVDYGTDKLFREPTHQRVTVAGPSQQRSVALTGLAPQTTYYYRLLCEADQPRGVFTTP